MYFRRNGVPITVAGVGGKRMSNVPGPTRWNYQQFGDMLTAFNARSPIIVTFNLNSENNIKQTMITVYKYRDQGLIDNIDLQELEERVRTLSSLCMGGNSVDSNIALDEISFRPLGESYDIDNESESVEDLEDLIEETKTKGKKYVVYNNGKRRIVTARGKKKVTKAVLNSISNARRYAHTPEADKKRSRSMKARRKDYGLEKNSKDKPFTTEK